MDSTTPFSDFQSELQAADLAALRDPTNWLSVAAAGRGQGLRGDVADAFQVVAFVHGL